MRRTFSVAPPFPESIIATMRRMAFALALLAAGCAAAAPDEDRARPLTLAEPAPTPAPKATPATPGEYVQDYKDVERYSGQYVSFEGTFGHIQGKHGVLKLDSGLLIYIPHFDLFRHGDDWLKYVGRRCEASGILHTYTKPEIVGYRGPSLQIYSFEPVD